MHWLNYHHLLYFWTVAKEGSIVRASKILRISPSTVSTQIKKLEESLECELFERDSKRLVLSPLGKSVLEYADSIFHKGNELIEFARHHQTSTLRHPEVIRVGALSSISKNLQYALIEPVMKDPDVSLIMKEGSLDFLVQELQESRLDAIISTKMIRGEAHETIYNHRVGSLPVCLVGKRSLLKKRGPIVEMLTKVPLFVPTLESQVRVEFNNFLDDHAILPSIKAEVEDMALLRLFAISGEGLALVPEIVVTQELKRRELLVFHRFKEVSERFFIITKSRRFPSRPLQVLVEEFSNKMAHHKIA